MNLNSTINRKKPLSKSLNNLEKLHSNNTKRLRQTDRYDNVEGQLITVANDKNRGDQSVSDRAEENGREEAG